MSERDLSLYRGALRAAVLFRTRGETNALLASKRMDTNTLLIVILVILLVGGGGFFYRGRRR